MPPRKMVDKLASDIAKYGFEVHDTNVTGEAIISFGGLTLTRPAPWDIAQRVAHALNAAMTTARKDIREIA